MLIHSGHSSLFLDLIEECHARGLKVVIDGVWNHVGQRHPAFADVVQRGPESPYADWFDVVSWDPFVHRGWAGYDDLPVFAKDSGGRHEAQQCQDQCGAKAGNKKNRRFQTTDTTIFPTA